MQNKSESPLKDSGDEYLVQENIFTIKRDLVTDNVIYLFAEPQFLGKFYTLHEVTMYVEKKKDILRTSAREIISVTIANVAGVAKVTFVP